MVAKVLPKHQNQLMFVLVRKFKAIFKGWNLSHALICSETQLDVF